ncbi:hypothetical protein F0342_11910 [Bacillus sp. CH30_1T]|uniref:hypothetical protein n=1 Tax=Bacillus sp. CH30_1T TaxID=2604836 RepID=UPI0011EFEBCE|nr:hypothetical protein [Bacillus sp. CH30_1T]KAA0563515.1 hypothetical protein F0342_11910 [Bacillus sp. CH30_1T]
MNDFQESLMIYKEILIGKRSRFPNYHFHDELGQKKFAAITRYLVGDHLNIAICLIPKRVSAGVLWKHRLRPPAMLFKWNYFDVLENAYPGQLNPLDFKQVPNRFWQGDEGRQRAIKTVKHIIEQKCNIPIEKIPGKIDVAFFRENELLGLFAIFDYSPYKVLEAAYPGVFSPWELKSVPLNFWTSPKNIKEFMDWFLFEKIRYDSYKAAILQIQTKHFFQSGHTGFFQRAFDGKLSNVQLWIVNQIQNQFE